MQSISSNGSKFAPLGDASRKDLTAHLNATVAVTGYAHAIQNLSIKPMSPLQPWYPALNGNLDAAKGHAMGWVDTLAPDINSGVPQAIINYGNVFTEASTDILNILISSNDNPDPAGMQQIVALLGALSSSLTVQRQAVADLQTRLRQFAANVLDDNNNLQTGADSIQSAINLDEQTKDKIKGMINTLQAEIAVNSRKAAESEIGIEAGIFLAVVAVSLALATGGLALLAVGAVAVLGVGAAITTDVVYTVESMREMTQLGNEERELSDETKQILALTGLVSTLNNIVALNEAAQEALTVVATQWDDLSDKLQSVITDVQNAGKVEGILQQIELSAAQTAWGQLVAFAMQVLAVTSGITVQPLLRFPSAAPAT